MPTEHVDAVKPGRPRWSLRSLFVVVVVAIVAWAVNTVLISPARRAWHREHEIHATILAIMLVDQFVRQTSTWPKSWADLDSIGPMEGWIVSLAR
jgi:hypothetical protein